MRRAGRKRQNQPPLIDIIYGIKETMKNVTLPLLIALVLLLTACAPSVTPTPLPTPEIPLVVVEEAEYNVLIQEFMLDPAGISIHAGTTITWVNMDAAKHTVNAVNGEFMSPVLGYGDTFVFTFAETGEYFYTNKYHPNIKGRIVVVP